MNKYFHFDAVNFLRTIAVLFVFVLHSTLFDGKNFPAGQVFRDFEFGFLFALPAWGGCWLLFALSGYLAGVGFENNRYSVSIGGGKTILC